jgi:hypothetical protein
MLSVERYNGTTWVNISDYVISEGTGKIPFIERNSDWSPIASTFDLGVSSAFGTAIVRGDRFRFYNDTQVIFAGYADKVIYDYERRYYRVQLTNDLAKLSALKLDYDTLNALIIDTADLFKYNASDGNINMLWAMQCCFTAAGLSLDISEVSSKVFYPSLQEDGTSKNATIDKFAIPSVVFYSIGVPAAGRYDVIDREYSNDKITLFEFISFLFKVFRFTITLSDVNTYKLHYETDTFITSIWGDANVANSTYTIADDNIYSYDKETLFKECTDAFVAIRLPDIPRTIITNNSTVNLNAFYTVQEDGDTGPYGLGDHGAFVAYSLTDYCWPRKDIDLYGRYWPPSSPDSTTDAKRIDWLDNLALKVYNKPDVQTTDPNGNPIWVPGPWVPTIRPLNYAPTAGYETPELYMFRMSNALKIGLTKDRQIEKITTDMNTSYKNVLKNFIDIQNRTSEIEQEVYL